jgi:hypothetical protein
MALTASELRAYAGEALAELGPEPIEASATARAAWHKERSAIVFDLQFLAHDRARLRRAAASIGPDLQDFDVDLARPSWAGRWSWGSGRSGEVPAPKKN